MVRRKVWIWATDDLTLSGPVHADRPHQPKRSQEISTVEYVVDDSLEIKGEVGVLHLSTVGPAQWTSSGFPDGALIPPRTEAENLWRKPS